MEGYWLCRIEFENLKTFDCQNFEKHLCFKPGGQNRL